MSLWASEPLLCYKVEAQAAEVAGQEKAFQFDGFRAYPRVSASFAANEKPLVYLQLYSGTLSQITDGKKEPDDDQAVEMRKGTQWVQIDLEKEYPIYAILIWHDHRWLQVFHDVVVQAADDPEFSKNTRTLFTNDFDNSSGLGIGTDKEYFETHQGKLIDAKGVKARYLRFYSKGSSMTAYNVYQEIEVYALPAP